tara:strand:- start:2142 stop:2639 length:498 start_codon:yes stop_codon:yes gene_type:complete
MSRLIVYVILLVLVSCANPLEKKLVEPTNQLKKLNWLGGFWLDTTTFNSMKPSKKTYERWNWFEDSIVGSGGNIFDLDTSLTENILIKQIDSSLVYIVRVKDKSMLSYNMVYNSLDSIVFENKAHDFPQKISYKKTTSNSFLIYLQGYSYEMKRELRLSYFRADF